MKRSEVQRGKGIKYGKGNNRQEERGNEEKKVAKIKRNGVQKVQEGKGMERMERGERG